MSIGSWIKQARKAAGLTQTELGERLGRTKGNISAWEQGAHEPSFSQVLQIADLAKWSVPPPGLERGSDNSGSPDTSATVIWPFPSISRERIEALGPAKLDQLQGAIALALAQIDQGLNVAAKPQKAPEPPIDPATADDPFPMRLKEPAPWESGWRPDPAQKPQSPRISTQGGVVANVSAGEPHAANDKFEKVPELGDVRLAAGEGIENDHEMETGSFQFRRSFLRSVGADGGRGRVVYASGDSMEPVIQDGAALLVVPCDNLTISDLAAGGVYAINYDGKMIVKTVARDRLSGRWVARSFNSLHPDIPLEDDTSVRVLGRVVWAGSRLGASGAEQWVRR